MKKTLGILGGMGPLATSDFFRKVISLTDADSDNEHIHIIIDNNTMIPDRTNAILYGGNSPLPEMVKSLKKLEKYGAEIIAIPCNTSHYFFNDLKKHTHLPIINILQVTAVECKKKFGSKVAAILATDGTLKAGLYQQALYLNNIPFIVPNEHEIQILMNIIYKGVKSGLPLNQFREDLLNLTENLLNKGADYFILGCTELPLVFENLELHTLYIDPTTELAKSAIELCGYSVKKPK